MTSSCSSQRICVKFILVKIVFQKAITYLENQDLKIDQINKFALIYGIMEEELNRNPYIPR